MDVLDVRVNVDDDIALQLMDRLPEVLSFTALFFEVGQDIRGKVGVRAEICGDFKRAIRAPAVDDGDLIEKRVTLHQLTSKDDNLFSDCLFLVQRRNA